MNTVRARLGCTLVAACVCRLPAFSLVNQAILWTSSIPAQHHAEKTLPHLPAQHGACTTPQNHWQPSTKLQSSLQYPVQHKPVITPPQYSSVAMLSLTQLSKPCRAVRTAPFVVLQRYPAVILASLQHAAGGNPLSCSADATLAAAACTPQSAESHFLGQGCLAHGLTAPQPVPFCDGGSSWAPPSSHSGQTLKHTILVLLY